MEQHTWHGEQHAGPAYDIATHRQQLRGQGPRWQLLGWRTTAPSTALEQCGQQQDHMPSSAIASGCTTEAAQIHQQHARPALSHLVRFGRLRWVWGAEGCYRVQGARNTHIAACCLVVQPPLLLRQKLAVASAASAAR
jgi:hypothetical protein